MPIHLLTVLFVLIFGAHPRGQTSEGVRQTKLVVQPSERVGFSPVPSSLSGVEFTNVLSGDLFLTNAVVQNGSGIAAGDIDGDGWCDLYFCAIAGGNKLFRNRGQWRFEDVTAAGGVGCPGQRSTGAVFADVEGDGDLDLLVNSIGGGTRLFLNQGKGSFLESAQSGLTRRFAAMSMALADVDGDGALDLYVADYRTTVLQDEPNVRFTLAMVNGQPVVTKVNDQPVTSAEVANRFTLGPNGRPIEAGEPDQFYRNDGNGHFKSVSFTDGTFRDEDGKVIQTPLDWGLSVMFRDLNGDGAPDLYVCNDNLSPDRIWINDGRGNFRALSKLALRKTSLSSMGVDFADLNRDGADDFIVLDMLAREHLKRQTQLEMFQAEPLGIGQISVRPQYPRNTLFAGRGDGTFAEIALFSGVESSDWSWNPVFIDVDLDGYEDLLISNGFSIDIRDSDTQAQVEALKARRTLTDAELRRIRKYYPRWDTANVAFRNRGDLTFEDVGARWGFDLFGVSYGMALADLDNDGDLDVALNNLNMPATLLRNDTSAPRIGVRLKGAKGNTQGIGARIKVSGGPVVQSQEVICGGRYLSGDDPMRTFAAFTPSHRLTIEVTWRGGTRSVVSNAVPNSIYEITEGLQTLAATPPERAGKGTLFSDVSELIQQTHHEEPYDDYERQPLLPKKLSQLGPGVAWCDLNGDGWDDLLIGSGRGGPLRVLLNKGTGSFAMIQNRDWQKGAVDDHAGIVGFSPQPGASTVLVGQSQYETQSRQAVGKYGIWAGGIDQGDPIEAFGSSPGALALADLDGDGDLDLFVGGRVVPGRYPEAPSSRIYRNEQGNFEVDLVNSGVLEKVGLVSGAVWSDVDGDGDADLVLACEWGPIRIFGNERGRLTEVKGTGLEHLSGWWNGITAGDVDGDGRMDLVASNWGSNSRYARQPEERLYYGEFEPGRMSIVETYYDRALGKQVPWRDLKSVSAAIGFVGEKFTSYREYGSASVEEIYGAKLKGMARVEANAFESMVFLNRGGRFEGKALPMEAQWAPAFGVNVADFDGDGNEDVFLSQNFFGVDMETSRYDAGRGLLLVGKGDGSFEAMPGQESGLKIYGEQRGSAAGDYDGDGRVDLVVGQNGARTKLYRNVGGRAGVRVKLRGRAGNVNGIGAWVRGEAEGKAGPVKEVHAGSGYWSQDSAVPVLSTARGLEAVWVRWPGGKETRVTVPPGAGEVTVSE